MYTQLPRGGFIIMKKKKMMFERMEFIQCYFGVVDKKSQQFQVNLATATTQFEDISMLCIK